VNLVPGDLYFLREVDVLDGTISPYCKIGLVKDWRQGDADRRATEHQTGNPRKLKVIDQVHAHAVSDLEKSVHHRFASQRILGEWFEMPSNPDVTAAVRVAKDLAGELEDHHETLLRARELTLVESSDTSVPPTDEDQLWFARLHIARRLIKEVEGLRKQAEETFRSALTTDNDAQRFAEVTERVNRPFATEKFAEAYPDLHQEFLRSKVRIAQRFLPMKPDPKAELTSGGEFGAIANDFRSLLRKTADDPMLLEDLHLAFLQLLGVEAEAKWNLELAEAHLKAACDNAMGIDGLCSWTRVSEERLTFDKKSFRIEHPELYEQFAEQVATQSFSVRPMRSYRPRSATRWNPLTRPNPLEMKTSRDSASAR
jgi:hypothetical protein